MKKILVIAVLVAALTAAFATSAFAHTTVTPAAPTSQAGTGLGYGAGRGIHTPGTGLAQGTAQGAGMGARRGAPEWAGDNEDVAKILGLTVEQLQAERLSGKSLAQIAGANKDTLIAQLLEARTASVNDLLKAGKITQPEADYTLANMAEHVKIMVERTNVGRPSFAGQSPMAGMGRGRSNR